VCVCAGFSTSTLRVILLSFVVTIVEIPIVASNISSFRLLPRYGDPAHTLSCSVFLRAASLELLEEPKKRDVPSSQLSVARVFLHPSYA